MNHIHTLLAPHRLAEVRAADPWGDSNVLDEYPTPWRVVKSFSEIASIQAANNRTVGCVLVPIAEFITACVNTQVPGGKVPF